MAKQIANLSTAVMLLLEKQSSPKVETCSYCGGTYHMSFSCAYAISYGAGYEEANYVSQFGKRPQGANFQGGYQHNWRNANAYQGGQGVRLWDTWIPTEGAISTVISSLTATSTRQQL